MKYPGFIGGSNENQAITADQQRTINWYVEPTKAPGSPSEAVLLPTPGVNFLANANPDTLTARTTEFLAPGRAHFFEDGREFAVIGTTLFEIGKARAMTSRGTVAADENPATISTNGDIASQLFITSGTNAYYYALDTNTLTQITAMDGKATMGAFLDGYFLALDSVASTLYISALGDGSSWTPGSDFAPDVVHRNRGNRANQGVQRAHQGGHDRRDHQAEHARYVDEFAEHAGHDDKDVLGNLENLPP